MMSNGPHQEILKLVGQGLIDPAYDVRAVRRQSLLDLVRQWEPLPPEDDFPDIDDPPPGPVRWGEGDL